MKPGTFAARGLSKQPAKEDTMRRFLIITAVAALALAPAACSRENDSEAGGGVTAGAGGGGGEGGARAGTVTREALGAKTPVSAPFDSPSSLPSPQTRVIQTASLSLSVPRQRFQEAVEEARSLASGLGGFVVSSSASQGRERRLVSGTLVLRIPERSYAQALKALAALGRVEALEETGQDVSQEFVDLESRARHLEAVERQLLELLNQADNVSAALAVQSRLDEVQLELEQVRGRLRYLDDQVTFATISLQIHERLAVTGAKGGDGRGIVGAWRSAAHGFVTVIGWIFVASATVAPFVLLLLVAWGAARVGRRTMPLWRRS
jgi:Domain of unknown function (DUF4349)